MKTTAFCGIVPCSLEVDTRFRGADCLHRQGGETLVYFDETTRHYIPEGCHLHKHRRENLKSHKGKYC
jgi:hypothetical protein